MYYNIPYGACKLIEILVTLTNFNSQHFDYRIGANENNNTC